jgi:succinate-semialdehyde dehydrogenase / glutarate-semialdehyde dehydrogenase
MDTVMHRDLSSLSLKDPDLFRTQAYVDGQWIEADDQTSFEVVDPARRVPIASVPKLGVAETRRAIDAAAKAGPAWRAMTAAKRGAILRKWRDLMIENADDLAQIMTAEQGKPLAEAKGEITYAASFLEWFGEEAKRLYGDTIPSPAGDKRLIVTKEPIGVCAAITPWNFPAAMITRKVAPALAAGCTIVVKPAEATPLSAIALAVLAERAGVPAGVLNIVTGDPKVIGAEMTASPIIRKLSFTGSTPIGRLLMEQSAPTLKKLSLELGGNAPFIVFEDADLDAAVEGAVASKYRNAGQTCVCTNRFYVHEAIYDAFAEKLAAAVSKLSIGNGFETGVTLGPLINDAAIEKVERHVRDAVEHGAKVVTGGKLHALGGTFYEPTVVTGVTQSMKFATEETFGPVSPLFRFSTDAEAIAMANATEFGLAAYFFSRDISRVWHVAEALEYGMVGINTGLISNEVAPFGGVKQSGMGREGSKYGIEDYLVVKYWCIGGV